MAMVVTASVGLTTPHHPLLPSSSFLRPLLHLPTTTHYSRLSFTLLASQTTRNIVVKEDKEEVEFMSQHRRNIVVKEDKEEVEFMSQHRRNIVVKEDKEEVEFMSQHRETILHSFSPLPFLYSAALLPGAGAVTSVFEPFVELVKSFNLPDWLVHWGHPGNMAVVLFAMGGYGTYLGFRIRYSDDVEEKAKAKDLHPKLLAGMFFFFALGATGGVTSLLTSGKPIFESPHSVTGVIGLALLTIQTILPSLFEGNPGLRNVHGILGSGIMTLFLIHAALGLQLGLSY